MSTIIESIERRQMKEGLPSFAPGDRVRVHFQVVEGNRRRTQVFEGVVLKRQGSGARETFTVRKQSFGVGVERTFPLHSPKIERLEIAGRGAVRRAKLYYLRGRVGKAARVAERRWGIDEEIIAAPAVAAGEALDSEGVGQEEVVPVEEPAEVEAAEAGEAVAADTAAEAAEAPELEAEAPEAEAEAGAGAGEPEAAAEESPAQEAEPEAETEAGGDEATEGESDEGSG